VARAEEVLLERLLELTTEGGEINLLMVSVDPVHVQLKAGRQATRIHVEAVANKHLPDDRQIDAEAVDLLARAGFALTPDESYYAREFDASDYPAVSDVAFTTMAMLTEIYGCAPSDKVRLRCLLDAGNKRPH
jgi:hypothetical protein